jgi:predicted RNase H-like HicB family nuclease
MKTTPLYPAEKYTYRVVWSEDDQRYVGVCTEFPSLSHLASSHDEALDGVIGLVRSMLVDMRTSKEEPPVPLTIRRFRGGQDR